MQDLPKRFVGLHGETLSNAVCLKLPCGQQWNIVLFKSHKKIYLQEGWAKFAKHYRLDHGHLLFFKYEGNSQFGVSICDKSACEIDYPSIPAHSYGNLKMETEKYDSVLPPSSSSQKRMRTNDSKIKSRDLEEEIEAEGSKFKNQRPKIMQENHMILCAHLFFPFAGKFKRSKNGSQGAHTSYRDSRAFKEASSFSSTNPFFRKVVRDHSSANYNMVSRSISHSLYLFRCFKYT